MTLKNIYKDEEDKLAQETAAVLAQKPDGFDDSAYRASKPVYTDTYGDRIDELLSGLEHRPDFSYDAENDPAYRQYRDQYRREGQRAAEDTLAAAATHAGGMNSYAVTAAQQAGDYYNAQLMDVLPELAQLAYERYRTDYEDDLEELDALRRQESEAYGRYQDSLADWYTELENAYQQYRDSVKDSQWQENFDHEKAQDALAHQKWLAQQEYEAQRDAEADRQWQEKFNHQKAQDALAHEKWLAQQEQQKAQDDLSWLLEYLEQQSAAPKQEQSPSDGQGQQTTLPQEQETPAAPYTGTNYYQDAINAAVRGDRATAEAALRKREEKMSDPAYGGTGGGTNMDTARQYIESLLASSEGADISERDASGMLDKSAWKEKRASGSGVEASYATYEDYVSDYLRYLTEG